MEMKKTEEDLNSPHINKIIMKYVRYGALARDYRRKVD